MLSAMNWWTVLATLASSLPKASICWMEALTMALKVPLIRSATKVGKAIALRVSLVTRAAWLTARGENSLESAAALAGAVPPGVVTLAIPAPSAAAVAGLGDAAVSKVR